MIKQKQDVNVDIYRDVDSSPVAVVLWDGANPRPMMAFKIAGKSLKPFSLIDSDDIPAHSHRETLLYTTLDYTVDSKGKTTALIVRSGGAYKLAEGKYPMTREQSDAIDRFRASHGRNWKEVLGQCWRQAGYPNTEKADGPLLQQLRNRLGPTWLTQFTPEPPSAESEWRSGKEATSLADGKALAQIVADELNVKLSPWEPNHNQTWEHAKATKAIGDSMLAEFTLGVSSGGVVSVNRQPFTPFKTATNVTYAAVRASMTHEITGQTMGSTAQTLLESAKRWYEIAHQHDGSLIGERLHIVDKLDRMARIDDGKLALAPVLADLNGFPRFSPARASALREELERECPEFGPFEVVDFAQFAQKRHDETIQSLGNLRTRVYAFPNGYREQAEHMFKWLQHESLQPEYQLVEGSQGATTYLTIPAHCVEQLRIFQTTNPARWGNHPDVAAAMDEAEIDSLMEQQKNRAELQKMTPEQREWIEMLHHQSNLHLGEAIALHNDLQPLAAAHARLCQLSLNPGLDASQNSAWDEIERRIESRVENVHGIAGVKFIHDPRGDTVGIVFTSGAFNSLSGSYKVPLSENAINTLPEKFWLEFDYGSLADEKARALADVLATECGDKHAAIAATAQLIDLASAYTELADRTSRMSYDQEAVDAVKDDLRTEMQEVIDNLNAIGRDNVDPFEDMTLNFSFDPRFSTVQVITASGQTDRMDREGWNVPIADDFGIDVAQRLSDAEDNLDAEESTDLSTLYGYYINLDERGCFSADVRNSTGETVYEIKAGDELGEDETSIFEDGFMKHKNDIDGLESYMKELGIIPTSAKLMASDEFESRIDDADSRPGL